MNGRIRKHRSQPEIISNILSVASQGAKKTHIMYRANLSFDQLNEYLSLLLDNGLLEKQADIEYEGVVIYKVTQKGRQFLEKYSRLQDIMVPPQRVEPAAIGEF